MKIIGFVGDSGSGKTTLVEQLIARFARAGLRVAAIKHAHHGFDIDRPGKDSYRFRASGARQVLVASDQRWVMMSEESDSDPAAALERHIARLDPCDLVIVEGYRGQAGIGFVEVRRLASSPAPTAASGLVPRASRAAIESERPPRPAPAGRIAIASDAVPPKGSADEGLPVLDLNDVEAIAQFIVRHLELPPC
jgi:molybdopterin-guanine dinucleotide biosynthesis protein B